MTTLSPPRVRSRGAVCRWMVAAGLAGWSVAVVAAWLRFIHVPCGTDGLTTLTFVLPAALTLVAIFRREERRPIALAAGIAWVVALAARTPLLFQGSPKVAFAVPVLTL